MAHKNKKQSLLMYSRGRIATICILATLLFCAIICRLYYLHAIRSTRSIEETEKIRNRVEILQSRRGNITDSKNNLLATSSPDITIGVDPKTFKYQLGKDNDLPLKQIQKMSVAEMSKFKPSNNTIARLEKIAELLKIPYDELYAKCIAEGSWHKLAVIDNEETFQKIRNCKIKAIYGTRKYVRRYPSGSLLSHIVGFVNKEFTPVMGIERQFDYYLRGQDGRIETERDGKRSEQTQFRKRMIEAVDGWNVELSIDLVIQEIVQRQMSKIAATFNPEKAAIIVSDPSTGYILAMAS